MDLELAKRLIHSGLDRESVIGQSGITQAIYSQYKRIEKEKKRPKNFGCVVCNGEKVSRLFCPKHYWTYIESNRSRNRRKAA